MKQEVNVGCYLFSVYLSQSRVKQALVKQNKLVAKELMQQVSQSRVKQALVKQNKLVAKELMQQVSQSRVKQALVKHKLRT